MVDCGSCPSSVRVVCAPLIALLLTHLGTPAAAAEHSPAASNDNRLTDCMETCPYFICLSSLPVDIGLRGLPTSVWRAQGPIRAKG